MKNTVTVSISVTDSVLKQVDEFANNLNVSRSAVITAMLSYVLKKKEVEEVVDRG